GGLGLKSSTSERLSKFFPPIESVVKRPFLTKSAIAWRETPRILAASAWETQCAGSKVSFEDLLRLLDIVKLSHVYFQRAASDARRERLHLHGSIERKRTAAGAACKS